MCQSVTGSFPKIFSSKRYFPIPVTNSKLIFCMCIEQSKILSKYTFFSVIQNYNVLNVKTAGKSNNA